MNSATLARLLVSHLDGPLSSVLGSDAQSDRRVEIDHVVQAGSASLGIVFRLVALDRDDDAVEYRELHLGPALSAAEAQWQPAGHEPAADELGELLAASKAAFPEDAPTPEETAGLEAAFEAAGLTQETAYDIEVQPLGQGPSWYGSPSSTERDDALHEQLQEDEAALAELEHQALVDKEQARANLAELHEDHGYLVADNLRRRRADDEHKAFGQRWVAGVEIDRRSPRWEQALKDAVDEVYGNAGTRPSDLAAENTAALDARAEKLAETLYMDAAWDELMAARRLRSNVNHTGRLLEVTNAPEPGPVTLFPTPPTRPALQRWFDSVVERARMHHGHDLDAWTREGRAG